MSDVYAKLTECLEQVRKKTSFIPEVALILGSGLGSFAESLYEKTFVAYEDIDYCAEMKAEWQERWIDILTR